MANPEDAPEAHCACCHEWQQKDFHQERKVAELCKMLDEVSEELRQFKDGQKKWEFIDGLNAAAWEDRALEYKESANAHRDAQIKAEAELRLKTHELSAKGAALEEVSRIRMDLEAVLDRKQPATDIYYHSLFKEQMDLRKIAEAKAYAFKTALKLVKASLVISWADHRNTEKRNAELGSGYPQGPCTCDDCQLYRVVRDALGESQ